MGMTRGRGAAWTKVRREHVGRWGGVTRHGPRGRGPKEWTWMAIWVGREWHTHVGREAAGDIVHLVDPLLLAPLVLEPHLDHPYGHPGPFFGPPPPGAMPGDYPPPPHMFPPDFGPCGPPPPGHPHHPDYGPPGPPYGPPYPGGPGPDFHDQGGRMSESPNHCFPSPPRTPPPPGH